MAFQFSKPPQQAAQPAQGKTAAEVKAERRHAFQQAAALAQRRRDRIAAVGPADCRAANSMPASGSSSSPTSARRTPSSALASSSGFQGELPAALWAHSSHRSSRRRHRRRAAAAVPTTPFCSEWRPCWAARAWSCWPSRPRCGCSGISSSDEGDTSPGCAQVSRCSAGKRADASTAVDSPAFGRRDHLAAALNAEKHR